MPRVPVTFRKSEPSARTGYSSVECNVTKLNLRMLLGGEKASKACHAFIENLPHFPSSFGQHGKAYPVGRHRTRITPVHPFQTCVFGRKGRFCCGRVNWRAQFPVFSMPNFSSVIKSEITRLARKEIKFAVDPIRKANAAHRREIAELKRQIASLKRGLTASQKKPKEGGSEAVKESSRNTRFVPSGLKSLRARLGLSASDFGLLVGASGQSVYNWEAGKSVPRTAQQAALAAARKLGKREAAERLEKLS